MARFRQTLRGHVRRARRVERFVRLLVIGGLALITGLWFVELFVSWSILWGLGVGLSLIAVAILGGAIWSQITYSLE